MRVQPYREIESKDGLIPLFDHSFNCIARVLLLETHANRGYITHDRGYGVIMVKPLAVDASFTEKYGDKFYLDRLDAF
jgi:hypothetical protein